MRITFHITFKPIIPLKNKLSIIFTKDDFIVVYTFIYDIVVFINF
ncbi:hypothetical protein ADIMK_0109 [Marinobacterium lacunae]|uniref:Uncharacterized protein n=1 Tax=Marinobacterium lacunae TaxID=1232683 RepID=A0A081G4I5_9GAMM|nr:hypothetical protein ADIMK_0109 [Marinobacterium lacunae]